MKVVILCGGRGSRLSPVTNNLAKACVPIEGIPSIVHLIESFYGTIFDNFILLSGYRGDQIEKIINTFHFDAEVKVIPSNPELNTAQRIINSKTELIKSEKMLLCYCDNIVQKSDLQKYFLDFSLEKILVEKRAIGNSTIDKNKKFKYYISKSSEYTHSELGYILVDTKKFISELEDFGDLGQALMSYAEKFELLAEEISEYQSISDFLRYKLLLENRRIVLIDRDGIINKKIEKGNYVQNVEQIQFIEKNIKLLQDLSKEFSVDFIVISNQAGIERKMLSEENLNEINTWITTQLLLRDIPILTFYTCPHHWDTECYCRKPKPGLIIRALNDFELNLDETFFIGDQISDVIAAKNAGIKGYLLEELASDDQRNSVILEIRNHLSVMQQRK